MIEACIELLELVLRFRDIRKPRGWKIGMKKKNLNG